MSAYLVAYFAPTGEPAPGAKLLGLDIFSEESPSVTGNRRTACVMTWPGATYAEAKAGLLAHLAATAPWLLPERNGGRAT